MHHRDIGTVAIELDAIALADRVLDDEGEEAEVSLGVPRDQVESLEVEGREVAMVVLEPLSHQDRALVRAERELVASGSGSPLHGLIIIEHGLESLRPLPVRTSGNLHLHQA